MRQAALISIGIAAAALLAGCNNVPNHNDAWLSYPYRLDCGSNCNDLVDLTEATNYYKGLGAVPGSYYLSTWLEANGFPTDGSHPDAHAIYANLGDLLMGRDMNCLQSGQKIACYVSNYGENPASKLDNWPDVTSAVSVAIQGPNLGSTQPFATVAMVYDPSAGGPNNVSFYAFDSKGSLLLLAGLDQEGFKTVPRMCMACHGGTYDTSLHTATGSSFLPFDVFYFRYSDKAGYTYEDQQESLRKLNALVALTNPVQPINDFINGVYPSGVATAGNTAVDGFVPAGWSDNPTLYTGVVRQYCRMCHLAQPQTLAFTASSNFQDNANVIQNMICGKHDMPHAQVPFGLDNSKIGFWNDPVAQRDLGQFLSSQGINSCLPSK